MTCVDGVHLMGFLAIYLTCKNKNWDVWPLYFTQNIV